MQAQDRDRDKPELHPVGFVRALGAEGASHQDWVRCERSGGSVPLERCRACPRCVALALREDGSVRSVTCLTGAMLDGERVESREPLRVPRVTVGDLMTRNVVCVRPDLSLDAVTELFVETGLKAAPVVDEAGTVLGVVSESDVLVDVYAQASASERAPFEDEAPEIAGRSRTVADVMLPVVLTLPETASITRAAALMAFEGVYRVTVVSEDGRVVGVLSAGDVLYWLARADGYALPPPKRGI